MTLLFRKKLFYIFIILFIIFGIIIIFYSRGYRFDFTSFSVVKTGAVYIRSTQKNIDITLNTKKYKSSSSIVSSGTLITNLIPKKYHIEIKKSGYNTYEKNIKVLPSEVVRMFNINLIPENISYEQISEGVKGDYIQEIYENNYIITKSDENIYYLCSPSKISSCTNITSYIKTLIKERVDEIYFYPHENDIFVAKTKNAIYRIDTKNKSGTILERGNFISMYIHNNNMYMTETDEEKNTTTLVIYDLSLSRKMGSIQIPFPSDKISNISFTENGGAIVLKTGELFIYNTSTAQTPILISNSVKEASFSPSGNKLIYQNIDGGIFVRMQSDDISSLDLKTGDVIKLGIISASEVQDIQWVDEYHIILTYPNKVVFAEIDNKTPNNQYTLFDKDTKSTLFLPQPNSIYSIEDGILSFYSINF